MRTKLVVLLGFLVPGAFADGGVQLFWSTTGLSNPELYYSTALTNFLPMLSSTPVESLAPGTYDLHLWGRFVEGDVMPIGTQIEGLDLRWRGDATHAENAAYRQRVGAHKRWDGSAGILLDGVMAAVTTDGIHFIVPPETNNDLYFPESREFLLGAARITGAAGQTLIMESTPGPFGDPWPTWPAMVTFTPEPAGLVLLVGLAAMRRR